MVEKGVKNLRPLALREMLNFSVQVNFLPEPPDNDFGRHSGDSGSRTPPRVREPRSLFYNQVQSTSVETGGVSPNSSQASGFRSITPLGAMSLTSASTCFSP